MNADVLLRELKVVVNDVFLDAKRGDADARRWFVESFPAHEDHLKAIWPNASKPAGRVRWTPDDFRLLERYAWNCESRLLIRRLAGVTINSINEENNYHES